MTDFKDLEARIDNIEDKLFEYTTTTESLQLVVEYLLRELNKYHPDEN
jgi:hypothetical protein